MLIFVYEMFGLSLVPNHTTKCVSWCWVPRGSASQRLCSPSNERRIQGRYLTSTNQRCVFPHFLIFCDYFKFNRPIKSPAEHACRLTNRRINVPASARLRAWIVNLLSHVRSDSGTLISHFRKLIRMSISVFALSDIC